MYIRAYICTGMHVSMRKGQNAESVDVGIKAAFQSPSRGPEPDGRCVVGSDASAGSSGYSGHSRESLATAARSDGTASPLLRVSTQRASCGSLASEQCLAPHVSPAEPAQQLAIPLESHAVEVPRGRGLGSEGSKAADYFLLEYFEGPQLLGLDIASNLSLNRCHSSAPPPRIIDRQPLVCHIDCCRDFGTYVSKELALK